MTRASDRLQVTQLVRGKREQVYRAFADPRLARKWCPDGCRVVSFKADMRVGGSFREAMNCGGDVHTAYRCTRGSRPTGPSSSRTNGRKAAGRPWSKSSSRTRGGPRSSLLRPASRTSPNPGSQERLVECPQELREVIRRRGQALAPGARPPLRCLPRRVDSNQVGWWYPGCRPLGRARTEASADGDSRGPSTIAPGRSTAGSEPPHAHLALTPKREEAPMAHVDPFASATELLATLRAGRMSASELTDLYIRRIERLDGRLNAVVVRDFDAGPPPGPRRRPGGGAGRGRRPPRPAHDDQGVLQRDWPAHYLWRAGVARLRLPARRPRRRAHPRRWRRPAGQDQCPAHARRLAVRQPHPRAGQQSLGPRHARPGGSSGGSAAAIAAGLSALEVGSDIGGSIRVPAVFCGVYGHRPSETLLPKSGQFPLPPLPNSVGVMAVQGPIARSAEDLELALSVLAGPDAGEDVAWRVELPPARHDRLADFRVAVLPPIPWLAVDDEITRALQELAARLGRLGATVKEAPARRLRGPSRASPALSVAALTAMTSARETAEGRQKRIAFWKQGDDEFARASLRGLEGAPGDFVLWGGAARGIPPGVACLLPRLGRASRPCHQRAAVPAHRAGLADGRQRPPAHVRRERSRRPLSPRPRLSRAVHGGGAARHRLPGRGSPAAACPSASRPWARTWRTSRRSASPRSSPARSAASASRRATTRARIRERL